MYRYINKFKLAFVILAQVVSRVLIAMTSFYLKDILDLILKGADIDISKSFIGIFAFAAFYLILDHLYIRVLNNMGLKFEQEFKRDSVYVEINSPSSDNNEKKFTNINEQAKVLKELYIKPKIMIYADIFSTIALSIILSFAIGKEYIFFVLLISLVSSLVNLKLNYNIRDKDQRAEEIRQEYDKNVNDIIRGRANIEKKSKTYLEKYTERASARIVDSFIELNKSIAYSNTISKLFVFSMNSVLVFYNLKLIREGSIDLTLFVLTLIYVNLVYFDIRRLVDPILKVKFIKPFVDDLDFDMNIMVEDTQKKESVDKYEFVDVLVDRDDIRLEVDAKFERGKKYLILVENSLAQSLISDLLTFKLKQDEGLILFDGIGSGALDMSNVFSISRRDDYLFDTDYKNNVTLFNAYPDKKVNSLKNIYDTALTSKKSFEEYSEKDRELVMYKRLVNKSSSWAIIDDLFSRLPNSQAKVLFADAIIRFESLIYISNNLPQAYLSKFDEVYKLTGEKNSYKLVKIAEKPLTDR
ncbi:MAG: hypothetical protein SPI59_05015 [Finegoldia sp.]|nr:hypothetical protein [Finegoldia sp.]